MLRTCLPPTPGEIAQDCSCRLYRVYGPGGRPVVQVMWDLNILCRVYCLFVCIACPRLSLALLNLSGNIMGPLGGQYLATSLKANHALKSRLSPWLRLCYMVSYR